MGRGDTAEVFGSRHGVPAACRERGSAHRVLRPAVIASAPYSPPEAPSPCLLLPSMVVLQKRKKVQREIEKEQEPSSSGGSGSDDDDSGSGSGSGSDSEGGERKKVGDCFKAREARGVMGM